MVDITFDQFDQALIKKEYFKQDIKFVELIYTDKEHDKVYLINIPYKVYVLQKYLKYFIDKNHHVIHLNNDSTDFDVYNLGIRDQDNESPMYKGWPEGKVHKRKNAIILIFYQKRTRKSINKQIYLYTKHLGRPLLSTEKIVFKSKPFEDFSIENLKIIRIRYLQSKLYTYDRIMGPYYQSSDNRLHVTVHYKDQKKHLSYPKFLMQEHLGRFLDDDETVHHKDGDYYNNEIDNLEIISRVDHITNDTFRLKEQEFICQVCNKSFTRKGSQLSSYYTYAKSVDNYIGPFCSHSCANSIKGSERDNYKNILPQKEFYNLSGTIKQSKEIC